MPTGLDTVHNSYAIYVRIAICVDGKSRQPGRKWIVSFLSCLEYLVQRRNMCLANPRPQRIYFFLNSCHMTVH